ncbi:MAG: DUF4198 domain-containing protein [Burkholderiaceae bacterium]|jgi:nickel transport protein|nr:DUF4198 domain-containing protein [Burkholderiaceae bacterium]
MTRLLFCLLLPLSMAANAHTAWIEAAGAGYVVRFGGHEGKTEAYAADKVKSVQALDAQGRALAVTTRAADDGVRVTVAGTPSVLALHFDNGIFSRGPGVPSQPRPMNEHPGATQGTHAIKYAKTVAQWGEAATRPLGQPFELVPLDAQPPRAGQPLRLRVLVDGRPAAGIAVGRDENDPQPARSDADGIVSLRVAAGMNAVWSGQRVAVAGEPRFTQRSIEYVLRFDAR